MKRRVLALLVLVIAGLLQPLLSGDGTHTKENPAVSFWGIWHGWAAPISLVLGFFQENIRV